MINKTKLKKTHGSHITECDVMSAALYPKVAADFFKFRAKYGPVVGYVLKKIAENTFSILFGYFRNTRLSNIFASYCLKVQAGLMVSSKLFATGVLQRKHWTVTSLAYEFATILDR